MRKGFRGCNWVPRPRPDRFPTRSAYPRSKRLCQSSGGLPEAFAALPENGQLLLDDKIVASEPRETCPGVDPSKPYVSFVGRITQQKGMTHLVDAIKVMSISHQKKPWRA